MASFDIRELYFAFLFLLAIQATASAHPNTISPLNESEPESAMDVYRPEVTKEIRDSAQELYESVTEAVAMMSEKMQANQPIQQKVLSQAAVEAAQLKRATNFLLLAGEPAGADYTYRLAPLEKALIASSNAFVKHPANQKSVDNARSLINKSKRSRPADTAKVQAMVDKGDFEKAEVAIYKLLDQLLFYTVLIPSAERFKYVHAPWGRLSGIIDDALKKKRSQEAADALEKKRDEVLAYAIQFIAEIGSAATSIGGTERLPSAIKLWTVLACASTWRAVGNRLTFLICKHAHTNGDAWPLPEVPEINLRWTSRSLQATQLPDLWD